MPARCNNWKSHFALDYRQPSLAGIMFPLMLVAWHKQAGLGAV